MGRGPSNSPHIGHLYAWNIGLNIQKATGATVIFQLSDDEKYFKSSKTSFKSFLKAGELYPSLLANMGFIPDRTNIFSNWENINYLYGQTAKKLANLVTLGDICSLFGFKNSSNIGVLFSSLVEIFVCTLRPTVPMVVVTGPDQAPFLNCTIG